MLEMLDDVLDQLTWEAEDCNIASELTQKASGVQQSCTFNYVSRRVDFQPLSHDDSATDGCGGRQRPTLG